MTPESIIKNFRDVGESVNNISGRKLLPTACLYRGGRLNSVFSHDELLNIPTILNLRTGKDEKLFDCTYLHIPAEDKIENYQTRNGKIRQWVNKVLSTISEDDIKYPIFMHCTSGKDRTGVITAAILKVFDVPDDVIIKEYLLSEGVQGSKQIKLALDGFGDIQQYLKKAPYQQLRKKIKK